MSNSIKSTLLSVALSITDGKLDTAATRAIVRRKLEDQPAIIRKSAVARFEEILEKVDPAKHSRLTFTFYTPKVELE